jgi:hypothetical protein
MSTMVRRNITTLGCMGWYSKHTGEQFHKWRRLHYFQCQLSKSHDKCRGNNSKSLVTTLKTAVIA